MTNALKRNMGEAQPARYGIDMLQSHVQTLNAMSWVRLSGRPYYIAEQTDANGVVKRYVERKMG